jgi:hypothetical protein
MKLKDHAGHWLCAMGLDKGLVETGARVDGRL